VTTTLAPERIATPAAAEPPRRQGFPVRPSVLALLAATAVLYLWDLTASGYGNSFYAAATQAGAQSWKAWLFGSLDPGNVITVDKPPAAMWVSGLFARLFGVSSWTVLAPQALEGVAAVGLLYATMRRTSGHAAGLMAGAALALTPVAVLMFRFNLPDALLVLLLVAGAYCTVRATEKASVGWLMLAGAAVGFGFLTKMLQAFLVLPAFGLMYLVAAPTGLGRRIAHLVAALGALVVSAGWFVALVALWPASSRPYIAGSTNNSVLELALGYNGFGRIFGGEGNPGGSGGFGGAGNGNTAFGGSTGLFRMFGASFGTEISWLLPAALIALVAGLWFTRRAPRTDRTRAALILWGGWMLVTALVFSFMSGITHPYYSVALAPAIAALTAIGGRELWRGRNHPPARITLGAMIAVTGAWSFILLHRTETWLPALRWLILVLSILVATLVIVGLPQVRRLAAAVATAAIITVAAASGAYALATASTTHSGSIPISGPAEYAADGFGGMRGGPDGETSSTELTTLLAQTTTDWAAATTGATSAANLQLASGKAVIAIGGWNGSDPAPTLAQFQQWVSEGRIGYYVSGGGMGGGPGRGNSEIAQWVADNYTATTVGGATVYDLRG
jgi:4-amino-4-deoxy-L-arabinose transferase-like glycosyltransferase